MKDPIKALERYAKEMYPTKLNAFIYGEERTNLINQIRTVSPNDVPKQENEDPNSDLENEYKELWIVQDDPHNKQWIFKCITLYKVPVTASKWEEVERDYKFAYDLLWQYFGVDFESCDRSDVKMF